jgi:hypothetical protein
MSTDIETTSRLVSIRDVLEHEEQALAHLNDVRLLDVLVGIEGVIPPNVRGAQGRL